jgi:hypothetical protein
MADPNAEFWNTQSAAYTAHDGARRSYHSEFAEILNHALTGDVRVPRIAVPVKYGLLRGVKPS